LASLFAKQVERTPRAVAVVFEEKRLTYEELNARANQLAHRLQALGVGPEVAVGVFMERSVEMLVALYGIVKAGGAYVPLDPEYPRERVALMLEDVRPPVLLTQSHLAGQLPAFAGSVIELDAQWEEIAKESVAEPENRARPENLAYVIFTSGSTGRPKGVMNTHRGICNRLLWMQEAYELTPHDIVLQKTPFSFDVSVWEFFWPLMTGARLVIAEPGGHRDSVYLSRLIYEQQVTVLHFVPSMLQSFLEAPELESLGKSLRHVICSGEALPGALQSRFHGRLKAKLHNLYGPT
jgi:amino acid adenylation domain-containing protein